MPLVWSGSALPAILPQRVPTLAISLVAARRGGRVLDAMTRTIERTLREPTREPLPAHVTPGQADRLT